MWLKKWTHKKVHILLCIKNAIKHVLARLREDLGKRPYWVLLLCAVTKLYVSASTISWFISASIWRTGNSLPATSEMCFMLPCHTLTVSTNTHAQLSSVAPTKNCLTWAFPIPCFQCVPIVFVGQRKYHAGGSWSLVMIEYIVWSHRTSVP